MSAESLAENQIPSDTMRPPTWDRKASLIWMGVILAVNNFPYIVAMLMTREGHHFTGVLSHPDDTFSYIAKMRLGFEGFWHYENRYTTEVTQPSLLFMFYIFLGHCARWLGLGLMPMYHVARVLGSLFLMFSVRHLIRVSGLTGRSAFGAFVFCFSVTAIPWLPQSAYQGSMPMEQYLAEAYCYTTMLYFAHLSVSTALLVCLITEFMKLRQGDRRPLSIVWIALYTFLIAWIHPRLLLTAGCVGLGLGVDAFVRDRRVIRKLAVGGMSFLLSGAIPAVWIVRSYNDDPYVSGWASIRTLSPPVWNLILGYGALIPIGFLGAWYVIRSNFQAMTGIVLWSLIGLVICYVPWFSFQRRMFQGLDIPLGLLAGFGLDHGLQSLFYGETRRHSLRAKFGFIGSLMLISLGIIPVLSAHVAIGWRKGLPWFLSDAHLNAIRWLGENTRREEVVLSSFQNGQMIPALSGNRVVIGHWAETMNEAEKRREVTEFFDGQTEPSTRNSMLERYNVAYLMFSSYEMAPPISSRGAIYSPIYDHATWRVAYAAPSAERPEVLILRRLTK